MEEIQKGVAPFFLTPLDFWVTFIMCFSYTHTHTHTGCLRKMWKNLCTRCPHAHSTLMALMLTHSSLRLSCEGPPIWKTGSESLKLVCAKTALEASRFPSPALPSTRPAAAHTGSMKSETQVASLSQLAHHLFNICWVFLVLFCLEWGGSGCNVTILIQ